MLRRAFELRAKKFLAMQSLFYAVANSIEALVPFLLAPILTRTLDPTEYGIWVLFVLAPFMQTTVQPFLIATLGQEPGLGYLFKGPGWSPQAAVTE